VIVLLALQAMSFGHPGSPIAVYKKCMAPLVWASQKAGYTSHEPPAALLDRIRSQCAREGKRVAEDIVGEIKHRDPDLFPPPTDEEAETLLRGQTLQWVSEIAAKRPTKEK